MPKIVYVKKAQQRYATVPVIDPVTGKQKQTPVMLKNGTQKTKKNGSPVFVSVTVADKTKPLEPYDCGSCRLPIEVGTPYKWVALKTSTYGSTTLRRHKDCPHWKQSELTSGKMSGIYAAQEDAEDATGLASTKEELESARDDAAEAVRAVGEEYQESATNIEDGFGHETYQSAELTEKAEALDSWADDIEQVEFDDPDCQECSDGKVDCETCDGSGKDGCETCNGSGVVADKDGDEECEDCNGEGKTDCESCEEGQVECSDCEGSGEMSSGDAYDDWIENQRIALTDVVNECPI